MLAYGWTRLPAFPLVEDSRRITARDEYWTTNLAICIDQLDSIRRGFVFMLCQHWRSNAVTRKKSKIMKYLTFAILTLVSIFQPLLAQEGVTTREPKWKQVGQAYGFFYAQNYSLNRIATEYPDLAPQVRLANFAFMSTGLGEGASALEQVLKREWPKEWAEAQPKIEAEYVPVLKDQKLTREAAIAIIAEVNQRAKGNLPESIKNAFLANNPAYVKSPGAELSAGWRQNFTTLKHPKSAGADITIGLPLSWRKRESTREGVVQVFRSGAGNGPILVTINCGKALEDADGDFTEGDMKELFTDAFIKESLPVGATLVEGRSMTIAGNTGVMIVFDLTQQELDIEMKSRFTTFTIAHQKHIITISFQIMGNFLKDMTLEEAQKAYFPTYRAIMGTLVRNAQKP